MSADLIKIGELVNDASVDMTDERNRHNNLALHICIMVNGASTVPGRKDLWREYCLPPDEKHVTHETLESYLLKPYREGLGMESLYQIKSILVSSRANGPKALAICRDLIPDFDARAEAQRLKLEQDRRIAATAGKVVAKPGQIGRGRVSISGSGMSIKGGNNSAYRIARLRRDYPAVAARWDASEFKSVRDAERAAGLTVPTLKTPLERVMAAALRLPLECQRDLWHLLGQKLGLCPTNKKP